MLHPVTGGGRVRSFAIRGARGVTGLVAAVVWGSVVWGSVVWGSVVWGSVVWGSVVWGGVGWAAPEEGAAPDPGDLSSLPDGLGEDFSLATLQRAERERGNGGADGASSMLTAGWDSENGFYISDEEKLNFLLRIGGYVQARYTYKGRSERSNIEGSGLDRSYFDVSRARFRLSGYVLDPNLTFMFHAGTDAATSGGSFETLDAYILYKAGEYFSDNSDLLAIGVGQFKPYFLRQELVDPTELQMVERSITNEFFNIGRSVGIWVQGDMGPLFYSLAVTNGFGTQNYPSANIDQIPAFIGKMDFSILGHEGGKYVEGNVGSAEDPVWVVGVSAGYDANNGTREVSGTQRFKAFQFGIDTLFRWSIFSIQSEYVGRWLDYRAGNNVPGLNGDGSANYAHGFYAQGGIFLMPGVLEVTGRVSTIWGDGGSYGNGVEVGPGINWYISRSHRVKLQTDLMYFDISGKLPIQSERLDTPDSGIPLGNYSPFDSGIAGLGAGERGLMWRVQLQLAF